MVKSFKKNIILVGSALALFLLIFDSGSALKGAREGVEICIRSLIPSLFPFFVVCGYFVSVFATHRMFFLHPIFKFCKIPDGAEALYVIGILGGYPVGAKTIADYYRNGVLDENNARRLLGFCSNAGPAFVFGIVGGYFKARYVSWVILGIQIISSFLTGCIMPCASQHNNKTHTVDVDSFIKVFRRSLSAIASVSAWVVLFRVFVSILDRWLLWLLPVHWRVAIIGVLELSNGCIELSGIMNDGMRFVLCAGLLSFGGLCVFLQTISVTEGLGTGLYFPGKVIQLLSSLIISGFVQYMIFPAESRVTLAVVIVPAVLLIPFVAFFNIQSKKTVDFSQKLMYNTGN